ncbi:MAG: AAA family ATPase [Bacteroidota bacterium]
MKHLLDFKFCPDCESKEFTIQLGSFLCLECHLSISAEVGYQPERIIELRNLLIEHEIQDEFAEILLKDNTLAFESRIKLLSKYAIAAKEEKVHILEMLKSYNSNIEGLVVDTSYVDKEDLRQKRKDADDFFQKFGAVDMEEYFKTNRFIPAIGRDEEIRQVENILKSQTKSCAMILGPSGSGISNLAMTVLKRIIQHEVSGLKDSPVYKIDSAFINTGNVSGDLESTLRNIVTNARNAQAVLLFDDCEQLAGQGIHRGTNLDVLDRFVPSMDGLKIIFSTSEDKYAEKLAHKVSFVRKTELVKIRELDMCYTIEILKTLAPMLLIENKTKFSDSVFDAITELSGNIRNRNLPDKCVSLMERVSRNCRPGERFTIYEIGRDDIINTLSRDFQIRLLEDKLYLEKLLGLDGKLKQVIKGQDRAIETICCELLMRDFRRADNASRPSVFYATGPTGVGKTEVAKKTAEFLTGDKNACFRIDMSQFNDYSKLAFLTGSSHEEEQESHFVKWVKNYPSGVLILDEFEKAMPQVQQIFLPIFDQGNMITSRGTLHFNDMIIFITSNAIIKAPGNFGFVSSNIPPTDLHEELAKYLPAELINRIQSVVFYEPLSIKHCREIVQKICQETCETFKRKGVHLEFSEQVFTWVAEKGYSPKFNARELDRVFDKQVLSKLSRFYFEMDSRSWKIRIKNNELNIAASMGSA